MARATGANAQFLLGFTALYGALTSTKLFKIPFVNANIGADQALIASNLLGRGRNPQDPILDVVNDTGDIQVPVDVRNIWLWLKLHFGDPVTTAVKASGSLTFSAQPANNSTITLSGKTWTFVNGAPAANQTQIGANLAATLTSLAADLNGSADVDIAKATYTATATALSIGFDATGVAGNAYTLKTSAGSNATASGPNLIGGGYQHVFTSGAAALPFAVAEIGFPEVPSYGRNGGVVGNSLKIALAASGLLDATINLIAQNEQLFGAPLDANPTELDTIRFGQLSGQITREDAALGGITSADFTYANNYDAVRVIRSDGAIDGADPGQSAMTGTITARFQDTTLLDQASSQLPCALGFGWSTPSGYSLTVDVPRVFLPRPKRQVSSAGGIEVPYAWQASYDSTAGYLCRFTLINDLAAADYAA